MSERITEVPKLGDLTYAHSLVIKSTLTLLMGFILNLLPTLRPFGSTYPLGSQSAKKRQLSYAPGAPKHASCVIEW